MGTHLITPIQRPVCIKTYVKLPFFEKASRKTSKIIVQNSLRFLDSQMRLSRLHVCHWVNCQSAGEHPDKKLHQQMNLLLSRLDKQQRRWYVAVEANRIGHGGIRLLSQITGMDEKTMPAKV